MATRSSGKLAGPAAAFGAAAGVELEEPEEELLDELPELDEDEVDCDPPEPQAVMIIDRSRSETIRNRERRTICRAPPRVIRCPLPEPIQEQRPGLDQVIPHRLLRSAPFTPADRLADGQMGKPR